MIVAEVGFTQHIYEAREDEGQVTVCIGLVDGVLDGHQIVTRLYSAADTALGTCT